MADTGLTIPPPPVEVVTHSADRRNFYIGIALYLAVWIFFAVREFRTGHSMTGTAILVLLVAPLIGLMVWAKTLSSIFASAWPADPVGAAY